MDRMGISEGEFKILEERRHWKFQVNDALTNSLKMKLQMISLHFHQLHPAITDQRETKNLPHTITENCL